MKAIKSTAVLSLLVFLSTSAQAKPIIAPLDKVDWQFSGDRFSCKLTKELKFDGSVAFIANSAQPYLVSFTSSQRPYFVDKVSLSVNYSPWEQNKPLRELLQGQENGQHGLTFEGTESLHYLLNKMEKGAWGQISVSYNQHQETKRWDIPAVSFTPSYQAFKSCLAQMLPVGYEQAKDNTFLFASSESRVNAEQRKVLSDIARYIRYDKGISALLIDGHTDLKGAALDNLWLSRQRAEAVADELVALGIRRDLIQLRAHGQRYPDYQGTSENANQRNRRVQLRLVKEGA
ncbi:OmpA family protein [Photobacterium satsumensis]|uniref:MotY family protein n=1 Tax=Photobacterium satsumensis TaxID=2910239 RepID=UPI003D0B125F